MLVELYQRYAARSSSHQQQLCNIFQMSDTGTTVSTLTIKLTHVLWYENFEKYPICATQHGRLTTADRQAIGDEAQIVCDL